ncbi:MAG: class I SAM-dependent methyltransferase [Planctomycetota bacterium]|jgi:SAM-dependent methyltransferase
MTDRKRATRAMYEKLPFPQRGDDHAEVMQAVTEHLQKHGLPDHGRWLDLGCGTGEGFCVMAEMVPAWELTGLDFSEASLQLAQENIDRAGLTNARVEWGDIMGGTWVDGAWDVVTALGAIHHLPDPQVGYQNVASALNPGGLFCFYYYGTYGRHDRTLQQQLLRVLCPDPGAFEQRVDLAKRLFDPKLHTGEPMADQWVADQFAHPCEHTGTIAEHYDMLESMGMELLEWLYVSEDPRDHFQDPEVVTACRDLSRRDLLQAIDLWTRKIDNLVVARKRA